MLKALGDETRYAMYEELARSTAALSASDLAERLGIHANTVRLHLERLREVGLVDVEAVHRGTVGRPQHLYFLERRRARRSASTHRRTRCSPACSPRWPSASAPTPTTPPTTGRVWGAEAGRRTRSRSCLGALEAELDQARVRARRSRPTAPTSGAARIEFLHCPFRELAEAYPELVCNLHRGLCEGVVDAVGGGSSRGVRDVVRP